jgi:hypothetical protein
MMARADTTPSEKPAAPPVFARFHGASRGALVVRKYPSSAPPSEQSIAEQRRREHLEERKAFAEPAVPRRFPPSIKSEYHLLCQEHGGPVAIEGFEKTRFETSCNAYRLSQFAHLLKRWQPDPKTGARHWPHMAFAVDQYAYRTKELAKGGNFSAAQIRKMLTTIERSAQQLAAALAELQRASYQLSDGSAPLAIPHVEWLDSLFRRPPLDKLQRMLSWIT